jgi:dienelactone hydrolase
MQARRRRPLLSPLSRVERSRQAALALRPWAGAAAGGGLAGGVGVILWATYLHSGWSTIPDILVGCLLALALAGAGGALVAGVVRWLRHSPPVWVGAVAGAWAACAGVLALTADGPARLEAMLLGTLMVAPPVALGAAVGLGLRDGFRHWGIAVLLTITTVCTVTVPLWLAWPGPPAPGSTPPERTPPERDVPSLLVSLAGPGGHRVQHLTYGSGADPHRPEFATPALRTDPVDGSAFLPAWTGWDGWLRRRYWSFDTHRLPVNGEVWYPEGAGPFPLVLLVHGNTRMTVPSHRGWAYLGEHLASRGFIVAAVDQSFLNDGWWGGQTAGSGTARAWLLLEHLRLFAQWNQTGGNPFHRRVDMGNIALVGHAEGGEAAYLAAVLNQLPTYPGDGAIRFHYLFRIKAVVTLSPAPVQAEAGGEQALRPDGLLNTSYLTLYGDHGGSAAAAAALRQYRSVQFTDGHDGFKAAVFIGGASASQFNSVWGRRDAWGPVGWLQPTRSRLNPSEQQTATRVYLTAFLEAVLQGQRQALALFDDHRQAGDLPRTWYAVQSQSATFRLISGFEEDLNLLTTTVSGGTQHGERLSAWREVVRDPKTGGDSTWLYLAWADGDEPDTLAQEWRLSRESTLTFTLADGRRPAPDLAPLDLTVVLTALDGTTVAVPISRYAPVVPPPVVRRSKWGRLEAVMPPPATFRIALQDALAGTGMDPARLKTITFRFDRTPAGAIYLDDVGIEQPAPGS